jgi:membrane protein
MERRSASKRPWSDHPRLLPLRRRSVVVDVGIQTAEGYGRHRSGRNAALIAHYGFLSIFPLILALTTILGLVLQGRPDLQLRIIDSVFARMPIVGQTIASDPSELTGSGVVLVFGLLAALWSGLRAFTAMQFALDDVRELPREQRSNFAQMRVRALIGVAVIGGALLGTAVLTAVAGAGDFLFINRFLLVAGAFVVNAVTVGLTFRWLCSVQSTWRDVLPGVIAAGIGFTFMQMFGTTVVLRLITNASPVYGTFATVIGLFAWLGLHANVALLSAELNEVLRRRALTPIPDASPPLPTG